MSKEEPAWKAELRGSVLDANLDTANEVLEFLEPHIKAAEQRGFQAGVNKAGDSVGKLREQLKTAKADALREAVADFRRTHPQCREYPAAIAMAEYTEMYLIPADEA